jgi:hypothetical protein
MNVPEVDQLRANAWQYWQVAGDRERLDAQLRRLGGERAELLRVVFTREGAGAPPLPAAPPGSRSTAPEWGSRRIRNALLWLGSALLVSSAIGFAGYEWTRLSSGGRSAVLVAITLAVYCCGPILRRRLPATAEALAGVSLGLCVVDWALLRHAGIGSGVALETWWALGSVLLTAVAFGLGAFGLRAGRIAGAAAAVVALPLVVATRFSSGAGRPMSSAEQIALWAAMAAAVGAASRFAWSRPSWRVTSIVGLAGAACFEVIADVRAVALVTLGHGQHPVIAGLAVATTATAPVLVRCLWRSSVRPGAGASWSDMAAAAATASLLGGSVLATSGVVAVAWIPVVVIMVAAMCGLAARHVAPSAGRGMLATSAAAAASGAAFGLIPAIESVVAPLGWWFHGWSGSLALRAATHASGPSGVTPRFVLLARQSLGSGADLAVLAAAALFVATVTDWLGVAGAGRRLAVLPRFVAVPVLSAVALPIVALAPLAAGASIGLEIVVEALVVSGLVVVSSWQSIRRLSSASAASAVGLLLAVSCLGWAAATASSTLVVLALACGWSAAVAISAHSSALRCLVGASLAAVSLLSLAGAACAAAGLRSVVCCLSVVAVAGAVLVASRLASGAAFLPLRLASPVAACATVTSAEEARRSKPLGRGWCFEMVAVAGLAAPDVRALALHAWFWLACDLTVAVVAMGLAAVRPGRPGYRWAAALGTMPLIWSWLLASRVRLPEVYTWPTAVVVTALSMAAARSGDRGAPHFGSWAIYGPGIALALLPSSVLAITHGGVVRPACMAAVALTIVLAGARWRLRSPIVLGGTTLVALGLNAAFPYVSEGPRWLTLAIAGAFLLWLGATIERRTAGVRSLRSRYQRLG